MQRTITIRSLICVMLMAVFALGITPKKVLHNWLADHNDGQSAKSKGNGVEIGTAGYHCQLDNVVAESPFISATAVVQVINYTVAPVANTYYHVPYISLKRVYSAHRGPPSPLS